MSIRDEARKAALVPGKLCQVAVIKREMSKKDAAELDEALGDIAIHGSAIARVLNGRGFTVTNASIQRHRRGDCSCE